MVAQPTADVEVTRGTSLRGRAAVGVAHLAGSILTYAVLVLLARLMTLRDFGIYATVVATIELLALPGKAGLDVSAIRFIGSARSPAEQRAFLRYALRTLASTTCVIALLLLLATFVIRLPQPSAFRLGAVLLVGYCCTRVGEGVLRGLHSATWAAVGGVVIQPVVYGLGVVLYWQVAGRDPLPSPAVVSLEAASFFAVAAGFVIAVRRLLPPAPQRTVPSRATRRVWLASSARLAMFASLAVVIGQSDVVVVSILSGAGDAGIYAAAWRLSNAVGFVLFVTNYAAAGAVATRYHRAQRESVQRLLTQDSLIVIAVSSAAFVALIVLGGPLLSLFGSAFDQGYSILAVLALSQLVNALAGPGAMLLSMTGNERSLLACLATAAATNAVLGIGLGVVFGAIGVAVGTLIAVVLQNLLYLAATRRRTGFRIGVLAVPEFRPELTRVFAHSRLGRGAGRRKKVNGG